MQLRAGITTSVALTQAALDRIAAMDREVHAFVHVDTAGALQQAQAADAALAQGRDDGPMHGVPYALKDIYDAAGMVTTCHSRLHLGTMAAHDSAVAARFRAGGAVLLGKLATFEFALGGPSFDLPFPPTRNPWDLTRTAGGSSSGSGAAIAAGYVAVAPGTCTTGSIRGPAAWCGTVGLKPSFGRVSRRGVFPLAQSLDHCGPLTRTVMDAAIALGVMAGHDPADPASIDAPVPDYAATIDAPVAGLRVGVPRAFFDGAPALTADARDGIERALALIGREGGAVADVALPEHDLFLACGRVLMTAEAFDIHRHDLRTRLSEYGEVTARRFAIGAAIGAADYIDALALQRRLWLAVDAAFAHHDVLVTAISLTPPVLDGSTVPAAWPLQASAWNVTGHPAISVPIGLDRQGLPLAVQIVGRPFDEATILRVARMLERASGWADVSLPGLAPHRDVRP